MRLSKLLLLAMLASAPALGQGAAEDAQAQFVATLPEMMWLDGHYSIRTQIHAVAPCATGFAGHGIRFDPDVGSFIPDPKAPEEEATINWATIVSVTPIAPKAGKQSHYFFRLDAPNGPHPKIFVYYASLADRDRMAQVAQALVVACHHDGGAGFQGLAHRPK